MRPGGCGWVLQTCHPGQATCHPPPTKGLQTWPTLTNQNLRRRVRGLPCLTRLSAPRASAALRGLSYILSVSHPLHIGRCRREPSLSSSPGYFSACFFTRSTSRPCRCSILHILLLSLIYPRQFERTLSARPSRDGAGVYHALARRYKRPPDRQTFRRLMRVCDHWHSEYHDENLRRGSSVLLRMEGNRYLGANPAGNRLALVATPTLQ